MNLNSKEIINYLNLTPHQKEGILKKLTEAENLLLTQIFGTEQKELEIILLLFTLC